MHPFLQNKYVRFAVGGIILLVVLSFVLVAFLSMMTTSTGLSDDSMEYAMPSAPAYNKGFAGERGMAVEESVTDSYYPSPEPIPSDYTSELEKYETTSYLVSGKTRQLDELCETVRSLKTDPAIHFSNLQERTNNCSSTFYVEENKSAEVLGKLTAFKGIEYVRDTTSVTRHRQQIESQTSIIKQQLDSVQKSLTTAETQLTNLTNMYLTSDDVATLSRRVNESLAFIDGLTQRKIQLNSQLNDLYQQASDLEKRIGVIEFSVNVSRSNPIYPNRDSDKWEMAWQQLSDAYTNTLIGLSAFFGIFLLWLLKVTVYLLVAIVILRGLTKFVKMVWSKW